MLTNYIKVALRSIFRNKLTAFINITGLALALLCATLIYIYVDDEFKYDRYNSKADRIYRITRNFLSPDGSVNLHLGHVSPPFGPLLKNDFGDFEEVARTLQSLSLVAYRTASEEVKSFNEERLFYAEPALLKIFDFQISEGNPEKVLQDPFTVMLSHATAKKYFGEEPAVGKVLRLGNNYDVLVTALFEDLPGQSHWHPEILVSFATLNDTTI
ncbi:MAG: ABC transporter permease [Cyclobacteriaceae bacterium]|nr:ABC transporter permease [Cyclobacteriaceae bacterium]